MRTNKKKPSKGISRTRISKKKQKRTRKDKRIRKGISRTAFREKKPKRRGRRRDEEATKERA